MKDGDALRREGASEQRKKNTKSSTAARENEGDEKHAKGCERKKDTRDSFRGETHASRAVG